jgi:hypothetical protein
LEFNLVCSNMAWTAYASRTITPKFPQRKIPEDEHRVPRAGFCCSQFEEIPSKSEHTASKAMSQAAEQMQNVSRLGVQVTKAARSELQGSYGSYIPQNAGQQASRRLQ